MHFKEREAQPGSVGSQVFPVSTREKKTAQPTAILTKGFSDQLGLEAGVGERSCQLPLGLTANPGYLGAFLVLTAISREFPAPYPPNGDACGSSSAWDELCLFSL